ncbi:MAG: TonB family protein [Candidatus Eiseniibacteriota bacterium]
MIAAVLYMPYRGVASGGGPAAIEVVFAAPPGVPSAPTDTAETETTADEAASVEPAAEPVDAEAPETPPEPEALAEPMPQPEPERVADIAPSPLADGLSDVLPEPKPMPRVKAAPQAKPTPKPIAKAAPKPSAAPKRDAETTTAAVKATPPAPAGALRGAEASETESVQMASAAGGVLPTVLTTARFRAPPAPPVYPKRAVAMAQEGVVLVRALIDTEGNAREIKLWRSSGFALLDEAALHAVRGWAFEPARSAGRAVTAWVEIPVNFQLR